MSGNLYAGASGFSYPSWRDGFYPVEARPDSFLRLYAERVNSVELNNTFYRVPEESQFDRWAAQVPDGFRFGVTMSRRVTSVGRVEGVNAFCRMAKRLGDKLGPVRIKVPQARDDGFLRLLLDGLDPEVPVAIDFRHDSWDDPEVTARLDERGVVRHRGLGGRGRLPLHPAPGAAVRRGRARAAREQDPTPGRGRSGRVRLLPARGRADRTSLRRAAPGAGRGVGLRR